MPRTSCPSRTLRTLTNCSSPCSNNRQFFPSRPATPPPTSPTRTSAAASTALPLVSNSTEASAKLSTPTVCRRRIPQEGKGPPYGSAEHHHRLHHAAAHPAHRPIRFPRPGDVPFLRHHHDCLVWGQGGSQFRRSRRRVSVWQLRCAGHDDRLRLCHDAVLCGSDSWVRTQLLSPHHRSNLLPQ